MGAASDISTAVIEQFIQLSTTVYPEAWRFEAEHIASYKLGIGFAEDALKNKDLHLTPFE